MQLSPGQAGEWRRYTVATLTERLIAGVCAELTSGDHTCPDDGPVLITAEYQAPAAQARDAMRIFRRREGAISWGIFRDLAAPDAM